MKRFPIEPGFAITVLGALAAMLFIDAFAYSDSPAVDPDPPQSTLTLERTHPLLMQSAPTVSQLELKFTPGPDCRTLTLKLIDSATPHDSLIVRAYDFTDPVIITALVAAQKRGVLVNALLDKRTNGPTSKYSGAKALAASGAAVALDGAHPISHQKSVTLIGTRSGVEWGSYNYSLQAAKNAEVCTLVWGVDYAESFAGDYQKHLLHGEPVKP